MAYEWMYGGAELSGKTVDQTVSKALRSQFAEYQASLRLKGESGFGTLTARNYDDYLLKTYLEPAATSFCEDTSSCAVQPSTSPHADCSCLPPP